MRVRLLNALFFYLAWFACVAGAAQGNRWLGPGVVALVIGIQILLRWLPPRLLVPAVLAVAIGFCTEFLFCQTHVYTIEGRDSCWPPLWLALLWPNFVAALPLSMDWLRGRPVAGILLGALGGPLSYYAGAKLGAIELHGSFALIVLAVAWGFWVPILSLLEARLSGSSSQASGERA